MSINNDDEIIININTKYHTFCNEFNETNIKINQQDDNYTIFKKILIHILLIIFAIILAILFIIIIILFFITIIYIIIYIFINFIKFVS